MRDHKALPVRETWVQLRDKFEAAGFESRDALYIEAALTGGEEGLPYPSAVVRLRQIFEETGWHPDPDRRKSLEEAE